MSGAMLALMRERGELRDAVLTALLARDSADAVRAWQAVDKAAVKLARERRRYDKYVREVCRNAGRTGAARLACMNLTSALPDLSGYLPGAIPGGVLHAAAARALPDLPAPDPDALFSSSI